MKRVLVFGALIALLLAIAAPTAGADVARSQLQSATLTVTLNNGNVHVFQVVLSPCDGSFTGTGTSDQGPLQVTETIVGQIWSGQLSFRATYTGDAAVQFPGYEWFTLAPGLLAGPIEAQDNTFPGTFLVFGSLSTLTDASSYRNHGEYVAAQPQGSRDTAATSCIGMPVQSH
jgi:hypothetical protein